MDDYNKWLMENPNNFSFWFPKIENCGIKVPGSVIVSVPEEILHSFYMEREGDMERIEAFVRDTVMPAIKDMPVLLFVKNGCFSNKFDFRDCAVKKNVPELTMSILNINYTSLMFETGGNYEVVIRERIGMLEHEGEQYRIYHGMPLKPEFRVFYDFDKKKALYAVNYWDWDYCHDAISRDKTDKVVYEAVYPKILDFYKKHEAEVLQLVDDHMKDVEGLSGIWSVDIMYADGEYWLIDMALGATSAYNERCAEFMKEKGNG